MRALILAAGRGSRMRALTANQPKCLVRIAGKPLLDWQLSALQTAGLRQIAVVRGYHAQKLSGPGYELIDNPRWAETNMVGSLSCASDWLQADACVVSYSDIAYHPTIIQRLAGTPGEIVISYDRWWKQLWTQRFQDPLSDAESFSCRPDGRLAEIGGRSDSVHRIQGQYMGLLKFTPIGWGQVAGFLKGLSSQERDRLDVTSLLRQLLAAGISVHTVPIEGKWCEVDSDEDLELYEEQLRGGSPWRHDWRWEGTQAA